MNSVFKPYGLFFDDVSDESIKKQVCRTRDNTGRYYDIKIKNPWVLPEAKLNPNRFMVLVGERPDKALVQSKGGNTELPAIGESILGEVYGEIVCLGSSTPPKLVGTTSLFSNPSSRSGVPIAWSLTPSKPQHEKKDQEPNSTEGALTPGLVASTDSIQMGQGSNTMGIGAYGQTVDADKTTSKTQEADKAGGMLSTAPNLLQHYFIGLANAVALPMPHMVNLIKMVAIGKFVKQMVGKKGRRRDDGRWESGSGIFGLADEVAEIAKK